MGRRSLCPDLLWFVSGNIDPGDHQRHDGEGVLDQPGQPHFAGGHLRQPGRDHRRLCVQQLDREQGFLDGRALARFPRGQGMDPRLRGDDVRGGDICQPFPVR